MNKKVIIGVISAVIIVILVILATILINNKSNDKLKINTFKEDKVEINAFETQDNKLVIKMKSDELVDFADLDIAFYNKNELVKTADAFARNLSSEYQYITVDMPKDSEENKIDITKIDIKETNNTYDISSIEDAKKEIKVESNKKEDVLEITLKTDSKKSISELSYTVLFHKGNDIISASTSYVVELNKEKKVTVSLPYEIKDGEIKYLDYDKAEVIINHAFKTK